MLDSVRRHFFPSRINQHMLNGLMTTKIINYYRHAIENKKK